MRKRFQEQQGSALIIVMLLTIVTSLSIAMGLISPSIRSHRIAQNDLYSKQSYFLAESGVEDALYRLRHTMDVSSSETLVLGSHQTITTVTDINSSSKEITSLGDVSNRERKVSATVTQGVGISFNYGVQTGRGGLSMVGSSGIIGNVYANGNIYGNSSSYITGSAIAANSGALEAEQTNGDSSSSPGLTIAMGQANATQDAAQSFTISSDEPINKVQLYIKKTGSPSNATVTIVTDNSGSPSTTVMATGTLSASLTTTSFGWVDVVFTTNPVLLEGVTYWIVIDGAQSSSNYYTVAANSNGYSGGGAKIGKVGSSWTTTTPSNSDLFFKLFVGGVYGMIYGDSQWNQLHVGTSGDGLAKAHTVNATNAPGVIYCKVGVNNNKACDTTQTDPVEQPWPVSDANIQDFKDQAEAGGVTSGNVTINGTQTVSMGPKKIQGNLTVTNSATLIVTGTLWVTGNVVIDGAAIVKMASSYGAGDATIVVDGTVTIAGSSPVQGSGTTGSYIMILSTSKCPLSGSCGGLNAINVNGASGAVVLVAQNGTLSFTGSARAKQATAYQLSLSGTTTVTYESGLADMEFTSGPSGAWNLESWKETE
jgi:Tfp pilus assembly protein PilX